MWKLRQNTDKSWCLEYARGRLMKQTDMIEAILHHHISFRWEGLVVLLWFFFFDMCTMELLTKIILFPRGNRGLKKLKLCIFSNLYDWFAVILQNWTKLKNCENPYFFYKWIAWSQSYRLTFLMHFCFFWYPTIPGDAWIVAFKFRIRFGNLKRIGVKSATVICSW